MPVGDTTVYTTVQSHPIENITGMRHIYRTHIQQNLSSVAIPGAGFRRFLFFFL